MNKIIVCLILMVCAGCQSTKKTLPTESYSSSEIVFVTIRTNQSWYVVEAKWVNLKSQEDISELSLNMKLLGDEKLLNNLELSGKADVIAAPRVEGRPNHWMTLRVVEVPDDYSSETKIMLDGEMVNIPTGLGTTLKVMITPQQNNVVHAKGILSVAKRNEHFEVPFDGSFVLGNATAIYKREECFGSNVKTQEFEETLQGTPLFQLR